MMGPPYESDPGAKRTRSSTPRTRTGCATCRARRVKCDQTRPACLRCVRTRRQCDGYGDQPHLPSLADILVSTTSYSIPFRMPGGQRDRQLLHYFCVRGSIDMSGAYCSDFWTKVVVQVSQDDNVVRQALVALSSLHLGRMASNDTLSPELAVNEPLICYGKAMRALKRRIDKPEQGDHRRVGSALICSILFYCAECVLGNHKAATGHLNNGIQLLAARLRYRQDRVDDLGFREHDEAVIAILSRLDMQASYFNDSRRPFLSLVTPREREKGLGISPTTPFPTIQSAQLHLLRLENWRFNMLLDHSPRAKVLPQSWSITEGVAEEKERLMREFDIWEQKLHQSFTDADEQVAAHAQSLDFLQQIQKILLESRLPLDNSIFHAVPNLRLMKMVQLAERAVGSLNRLWEKHPGQQMCSAEIGTLTPLFFLVMKVSDTEVRVRATKVLSGAKYQEGLFDAVSMGAIVKSLEVRRQQTIEAMESMGLDIPENQSLEWWNEAVLTSAEVYEGYVTTLKAAIS